MVYQDKYESYLISLGEVIKEYALEAKKNKDMSIGTKQESFQRVIYADFIELLP
jgi:hypothetical protein